MEDDDRVSKRLAELSGDEVEAVMVEAAIQFGLRESDDSLIEDFIENGLDMVKSGEYEVRHDPNFARHVLVHKATGI